MQEYSTEEVSWEEYLPIADQVLTRPDIIEMLRLEAEVLTLLGKGVYKVKQTLDKKKDKLKWVVYDHRDNYLLSFYAEYDCKIKKKKFFRVGI